MLQCGNQEVHLYQLEGQSPRCNAQLSVTSWQELSRWLQKGAKPWNTSYQKLQPQVGACQDQRAEADLDMSRFNAGRYGSICDSFGHVRSVSTHLLYEHDAEHDASTPKSTLSVELATSLAMVTGTTMTPSVL